MNARKADLCVLRSYEYRSASPVGCHTEKAPTFCRSPKAHRTPDLRKDCAARYTCRGVLVKRLLLVTAIVLVFCRCLEAQVLPAMTTTCSPPSVGTDDSPPSPPAFANDVRPHPPTGPGAWVLQIARQGGFSGTDGSEMVIDSTGRLTCYSTGPACEENIDVATLAYLDVLVRSANPSQWIQSVSAVCSDCVKTALVLRFRNAEGVERSHTAC